MYQPQPGPYALALDTAITDPKPIAAGLKPVIERRDEVDPRVGVVFWGHFAGHGFDQRLLTHIPLADEQELRLVLETVEVRNNACDAPPVRGGERGIEGIAV